MVPSLEGAVVGRLGRPTGLVDSDGPDGAWPDSATLTASLLTAGAVALVFAAASRHVPGRVAAVVSLGLAFGTNLWPLASRSLWQVETVSFGFALALFAWWRPAEGLGARDAVVGAVGLALAGATRLETAPMIAVLLAGLTLRGGVRRALPAVVVVGVAAITLMAAQWSWFGSVMGAKLRLQADGLAMHGVSGTLSSEPWIGAAGLLISPSRGLIAFSPIVLIPVLALPAVWRLESATGERWWVAAAARAIRLLRLLCHVGRAGTPTARAT